MVLLYMWSPSTAPAAPADSAEQARSKLKSHCLTELDYAPEVHQHSPPRRRWWQLWRRLRFRQQDQQASSSWDSIEQEYEYLQRRRPVAVLSALYATTNNLRARSFIVFGLLAASIAKGSDDLVELCKSLPRTLKTLSWAVQAAYSYKAHQLHQHGSAEDAAAALAALHGHWALQLVELCRRNGGIYVKAGQFASAFAGLPPEYRTQLAELQDKATPRPYHQVDRVIRQELGAPAELVFAEFEQSATAAASLAQVHRAKLHSGREVAVKIQYPGLQGAANADLTTFRAISAVAALLFPGVQLAWLYSELAAKMEEELDFQVEVRNAARLLQHMAGDGTVRVPRVFIELSTSKILTMEWVQGVKVTDVAALQRMGISPRQVGLRVDDAFAKMTFLHGFVHADPHPGNIMVRAAGRRGLLSWLFSGSWQPFEVVLLDHGLYLDVPEHLREQYCQLWCALFMGDRETARCIAQEMGGARAGQILPVILTHQGRNKAETEAARRAAGLGSLGDITALLATAPRDLVEVLRITTVVRNVTHTLGVGPADRLRTNASYAAQGLPSSGKDGGEVERRMGSVGYRLQLGARLGVIRACVAVATVLDRVLGAATYMLGYPVLVV